MNKKNDSALVQGSILAVASLISRVIGMLYKIPLTNILGETGMGYYTTAHEVYNIVLILSSLSIPLAVSKLVSARDQKREYKYSGRIFKVSLLLGSITGGIAGLLVFLFAKPIAVFMGYSGCAGALRVLGPTIFLVAILGVFRGLFQGKKNMVPTAISQLIEQIINAIVSLLCVSLFMKAGTDEGTKATLGATGGTMGILLGAVSALLFMYFIYYINRGYFARKEQRDEHTVADSDGTIFLAVVMTMLPIVLSQLVFQASGVIDAKMLSGYFRRRGFSDEEMLAAAAKNLNIDDLISAAGEPYSNKFRQLTNIPVAIATALSAAIVPTLSALVASGNIKKTREKIATGIKLNMIVAIPAAVGMGVLGPQIIYLLFPNAKRTAGELLMVGSVAIVFFAYSTMTNGILQGLGHMRLPVIHAAISLAIHIGVVWFMLNILDLELYGMVIGNISFALVVCILNWIALRKYAGYRQEIIKTFLDPLVSAALMGVATLLSYNAFDSLFLTILKGREYISNLLAVLISIVIALFVYFAMLLILRTCTETELNDFPMGGRFIRIAKKLNLLPRE